MKGNDEGGVQFEIAHRLYGENKVVESLECDDDHATVTLTTTKHA